MKQNTKCKKHNSITMEYVKGYGSGHIWLCPVCNKIKQAKQEKVRVKEEFKRQVAQLRKEILNLKCSKTARLYRLNNHLNYLNNNPQEVIENEIKQREEFNKEHGVN